ncbi:DNA primase [Anopheles sinensis]|uniref:DNA primase n=1 Tax=Anopheles sinensis TaxID=74873 RepID=A0A084WH83_ANOSI|nr:DNA primase [Anopheles sinensis]
MGSSMKFTIPVPGASTLVRHTVLLKPNRCEAPSCTITPSYSNSSATLPFPFQAKRTNRTERR